MKIQNRARYENKPKFGLIRASKVTGNKPIEYTLQLFDETKGMLKLNKNKFNTVSLAISHANLYGYVPSDWKIDEIFTTNTMEEADGINSN